MPAEEVPFATTRLEIADAVADAFVHGPTDRDELIVAARANDASGEVLLAVASLPQRRYATLRDLWPGLPHVPVEP